MAPYGLNTQLPTLPARLTQDWLVAHRAEIEVHYLPTCSPELNMNKGINGDLKLAVPCKAPTRSTPQLKRAAISHLHSLSEQPRWIRFIFRHQQFRYAA